MILDKREMNGGEVNAGNYAGGLGRSVLVCRWLFTISFASIGLVE
jgi:hypothetical protein